MMPADNGDNTRQLFKSYNAKSPQEIADCYDNWAEDYKTHMNNVGYLHPAMIAGLMMRHVPVGTGPFLNAGAGTRLRLEPFVDL